MAAIAAAHRNRKRQAWKGSWIGDIAEVLLRSAAKGSVLKVERTMGSEAFGLVFIDRFCEMEAEIGRGGCLLRRRKRDLRLLCKGEGHVGEDYACSSF
jgi:hypothetical protein